MAYYDLTNKHFYHSEKESHSYLQGEFVHTSHK